MAYIRKREKIIAMVDDLPNGDWNEDMGKVKKEMEDILVADSQKDLKGINGIIIEVQLHGARKAFCGGLWRISIE